MSEYKIPVKYKVPVGQKAAFGAGHFVLNMLPGALGFFSFFLLTAFGVDPFLAGLLGGLPRIWDAITDPIMGFISDNTRSRWGRRRPYIFVGAILSGIFFIILWQLDEKDSSTYIFWYFLIMSLVFLVGNTIFATPLVGLGYEMTPDYNERTHLMAFANTMGQIAWMIVPWFWVIIADPEIFDSQAQGVRQMSLIVGAACIFLGVLPAIFCRGISSGDIENMEKISFNNLMSNLRKLFKGIAEVARNKPFLRLCGATFLIFNGFQVVAAFSVFIIVFYMYNGSYELAGTWPAWFSTLSAIITAFIVIPIVAKLADKFGKRNAFIISTMLSIVGYILKWWGFSVPLNDKFNETGLAQAMNNVVGSIFGYLDPILENLGMSWFSIDASNGIPWLIFLPIPLIAFGLGGLFTLMMSMTADVCDLDELENGMPRKEATYGALYWWMVKLGQGLALAIGGAVLKMVGFISDAPTQTAETMVQLRIADIVIPAGTALLAIVIMWNYGLSEKRSKEIKEELVKRRGELELS
jgi:GPH family glycoside/pentoside/hexuronide:cation symporter